MTPLFVFGASGHARVIIDAVRRGGQFVLAGLIGGKDVRDEDIDGVAVVGGEGDLPRLSETHPGLQGIIGIGDNRIREAVAERVLSLLPGFVFATVIHPSTTIASDVRIGSGTFVSAGAIINVGSRVGAHVIVNTGANIDHHAFLDDFSFIAPGATLAGNVTVGRGAFVGTGANVIPGRVIGKRAMVGAGAAVIRDVPDENTVVGIPARPIKPIRSRT